MDEAVLCIWRGGEGGMRGVTGGRSEDWQENGQMAEAGVKRRLTRFDGVLALGIAKLRQLFLGAGSRSFLAAVTHKPGKWRRLG